MRAGTLAAVATLALTMTGAACGGGDARPSTGVYADSINDICRTADRAIGDLDQPTSLGDLADYADEASQAVQDAVSDIKRLALPSDSSYAADAKDFVAGLEDEIDLIDDIAKAAKTGDQATIDAKSEKLVSLVEDNAALADDLDAKRCGFEPMAAAAIAAPVETVPVETVPVDTIPPITLPPVTVPPATVSPVDTTPVDNTPLDSNKVVEALAPQLTPQGDYFFEDVDSTILDSFQLLLELGPVLRDQPGSIGGVTVYDGAGNGIGRVFVFVSTGTLAPGSLDEAISSFGTGSPEPVTLAGYDGVQYPSEDGATWFFVGSLGDVVAWVASPAQEALGPVLQAVVESAG